MLADPPILLCAIKNFKGRGKEGDQEEHKEGDTLLFQGNLTFLMKRKGLHKNKIDFMVCFRSTDIIYTFLESLLPGQFIETIEKVPDQPQDDQEAQEHHQYVFF